MKVKIYQGDITTANTDAIVNAANSELWMGAGVAGAIKRKGGQIVEDEALALGPIEPGEAVATTAGNLPHTYVIHAAGMGPDLKTSAILVYESTLSGLELAEELGISSVAFPAIGTGVGGLGVAECAQAMKKALDEFAPDAEHLEEVHFVIFGRTEAEQFRSILED